MLASLMLVSVLYQPSFTMGRSLRAASNARCVGEINMSPNTTMATPATMRGLTLMTRPAHAETAWLSRLIPVPNAMLNAGTSSMTNRIPLVDE